MTSTKTRIKFFTITTDESGATVRKGFKTAEEAVESLGDKGGTILNNRGREVLEVTSKEF